MTASNIKTGPTKTIGSKNPSFAVAIASFHLSLFQFRRATLINIYRAYFAIKSGDFYQKLCKHFLHYNIQKTFIWWLKGIDKLPYHGTMTLSTISQFLVHYGAAFDPMIIFHKT
jgi:hypothetical protein